MEKGIKSLNQSEFKEKLKQKVVGYYWLSDQKQPALFESESEIDTSIFDTDIPFVVEGMFYLPGTKESIVYKKIDVNTICYSVDQEQIDYKNKVKEIIPMVRKPKGTKLVFQNIFKNDASSINPKASTKTFICRVFTGFKKIEL